MIIDSNLVFFDGVKFAAGDSEEVALNGLLRVDHQDAIPMFFRVVGGDVTGLSAITIKLRQADKKGGVYEDVPGSEVKLTGSGDTTEGKTIGWRFVPQASKPWLKINVTASGSASGEGKVFAAVMREDDLPYVEGMFIDKGVVQG